jgi:hypothetical protein
MAPSRARTALATPLAVAPLTFFPFDVLAGARSRSSGYAPRSSPSGGSHRSILSSSRSSIKCDSGPRDSRGKIKRDPNAVSEFNRTNPKLPRVIAARGITSCR